jgi:hypothetical protein
VNPAIAGLVLRRLAGFWQDATASFGRNDSSSKALLTLRGREAIFEVVPGIQRQENDIRLHPPELATEDDGLVTRTVSRDAGIERPDVSLQRSRSFEPTWECFVCFHSRSKHEGVSQSEEAKNRRGGRRRVGPRAVAKAL